MNSESETSSEYENSSSVDDETNHPFSNGEGTKTEVRSLELLSPLLKCSSYIDINDVSSREWDIQSWPSKFKRLELLNRGIYNGAWANQELKRGQDDWYLCQNISCQVELPGRLKETLWQIFKGLDMRSFKKYEKESNVGYSIRSDKWSVEQPIISPTPGGMRKQYLVVFCITALLHNQTKYNDQPGYYPGEEIKSRQRYGVGCRHVSDLVDEELEDRHELLHQFATELGFGDGDIRSCMEKLRRECPRLRDN